MSSGYSDCTNHRQRYHRPRRPGRHRLRPLNSAQVIWQDGIFVLS